jgi:hypothetical protein
MFGSLVAGLLVVASVLWFGAGEQTSAGEPISDPALVQRCPVCSAKQD